MAKTVEQKIADAVGEERLRVHDFLMKKGLHKAAAELIKELDRLHLVEMGDRKGAIETARIRTLTLSNARPPRQPKVGDRKTVRGVEYVRVQVHMNGDGVVPRGRPRFAWVVAGSEVLK
jgi:hypothetical protein